jgi:Clr5 domain
MKLNWNGRATQAAPIADSEWEKHKTVILHLRPLMTLECLMVIMARDHNFTAS